MSSENNSLKSQGIKQYISSTEFVSELYGDYEYYTLLSPFLKQLFISDDKESIFEVVKIIREFKPKVIITNSKTDRHPDHESAASLVKKACFLSGLIKINTKKDNLDQESWRPKSLLYSIQNNYVEPHFVVDVSKYIDIKINAIKCFKSQFYDPKSEENESLQ